MSNFTRSKGISFKFAKSKIATAINIKNLEAIPYQTSIYSDLNYKKEKVNFNNIGLYNYWSNFDFNDKYNKNINIIEYHVNLNSNDRILEIDKNPLEFTIFLNQSNNYNTDWYFPETYKNIKYINIEHIVFPFYYQLFKYNVISDETNNNILLDISNSFILNDPNNINKINTQIITDNNSYEICNVYQVNNLLQVNFTINLDKLICYCYTNNSITQILDKYIGFSIQNPGNYINYISLYTINNKYIFSTSQCSFTLDVYPKMKLNSNLYIASKKSFIVYKNCDLITINKFSIKLLDNQFNPIIIKNLDYNINYNLKNCYCSYDIINYSCKCYYLRHPLNKFFQIDIFLKVGCLVPDINQKNNIY